MSNYILTVDSQDYNIQLARTGGQGSRGDSVTNAAINGDNDLIITLSDSSGAVSQVINAGSITPSLEEVTSVNAMTDVTITSVGEGDILQYDSDTSQFVNHTLTTSIMTDVDNTALADGALYVYNGTTNKHTATNNINNSNTTITGGSF